MGVKRLLVMLALTTAPAMAQDEGMTMRAEIVPFDGMITAMEGMSSGSLDGVGAYVFAGDEAFPVVLCPGGTNEWCVGEPLATPTEASPYASRGPAALPPMAPPVLPDGKLATHPIDGGAVEAWFAEPTEDYAQGVLGDAVEARALGCATVGRGGIGTATHYFRPTADAVFEDLEPRLVDLDADGRMEIVTVISEPTMGASLAVFVLRTEPPADAAITNEAARSSGRRSVPLFVRCELMARTPPIGTPNRWLNPAAIHDFDGDGILDVALVETPHIGGDLQLWSGASLLAGEPRMLAARRGYSNHAIGSRALDLAEVARVNGTDVLVLPDAERNALVAVAFTGDDWKEIGRVNLPGRVGTNIAAVGRDLALGLEDGRLVRVTLGAE